MKIWHSLFEAQQEIVKNNVQTILTIGNFDGVHRGHQAIMQRMRGLKKQFGGWTVAFVFANHTESIIGKRPLLINPKSIQNALLAEQGLDAILEVVFDEQLAETAASDFFHTWIIKGLHALGLVVGHDFRFGAGGQGDYDLLEILAPQYRLYLEQVAPLCEAGMIISSSNIRNLLARGEIEVANRMLGYSFIMEGLVTSGVQLGRKLGYPTANLKVDTQFQLPCYGVYLVRIIFDQSKYYGLANLGMKPTFEKEIGNREPLLEVYLFDVDINLYDQAVQIEFLHFIRPERRFAGSEELQKQIREDVIAAKILIKGSSDNQMIVPGNRC